MVLLIDVWLFCVAQMCNFKAMRPLSGNFSPILTDSVRVLIVDDEPETPAVRHEPPPPYPVNSAEYTANYNEIREKAS